jgi:hypothetical protein
MQVDTTQFQARHNRQPRGFGRWGFLAGNETFFFVGQYNNSKKRLSRLHRPRVKNGWLCCQKKTWPPRAATLRGQNY